jgi:hypothetical protein
MVHKLKTICLSTVLVSLLSGTTVAEAAQSKTATPYPSRTEGFALGFGAGVKFLNLKNIITKTIFIPPSSIRSHDAPANTSSPVLGIYARNYMSNLLCLPAFLGFEFNYLTQMRKTDMFASMNTPGGGIDSGYQYRERWDARAMLGVQVWDAGQIDFWAQAGLQVTNFDYEGITRETPGGQQRFKMDNNYALAPAIGLEARFSQPGLVSKGVVTDFILGWTAGYRNAFVRNATSPLTTHTYDFAMSSNWNHTFGFKVMFRY